MKLRKHKKVCYFYHSDGGAYKNTPTTSQYLIRLPEPKIDNKKFVWEDHTQHRGRGWGNQDPSTGDRGAGAAEQSRDQSVGDSTFETRQLSGREPAPPSSKNPAVRIV